MALTKGISFINLRMFVTDRFGERAWEDLLTTLSDADAAVLRTVVTSGWYEHALHARLVVALCDRFSSAAVAEDLGRFEAERDLTTVYRCFIRLVRPSFAIRNMNLFWRRTEDTGRWTSEVRGSGVVARLYDWNPVEPALCRYLRGYLRHALGLLGGEEITIEHSRCRAGGNAFCEFTAEHFQAQGRARTGKLAISSADLPDMAHELANLSDLDAVADAIVDVLQGWLLSSHVALWLRVGPDRNLRLFRATGRRGTGDMRRFVLQVGGTTVGRLDIERRWDHVEAEILDQLLPCFAVALRGAGASEAPALSPAPDGAVVSPEQRLRRVAVAAVKRWAFTPRQHEVLDLLLQGLSNKEIACELGCQEGTVEVHVSQMLKKSGAANRAALVGRVWAKA